MSFVFNSGRGRWFGSKGVTSLEFAVVLVPFLWMTFAIFDIGRYLFTIQAMVTVMTEAERLAVVNPSSAILICGPWANTATITPLLDSSQTNVCITSINSPNTGGGSVSQFQVTVTYPFNTVTPGLGALDSTALTQTATISY